MKTSDFIFPYPSGLGSPSQGICRVRLFVSQDRAPIALLTDLDSKNGGWSVTNAAESIIQTLIQRGYVTPEFKFIEHYEKDGFQAATFDYVAISPSGKPVWEKTSQADVIDRLACLPIEVTQSTLVDRRLADEIDRLRRILYPQQLPHVDSAEIIQRKLQIEASMLSKAQLQAAIQAGSNEHELRQLLRRDLSLLGEAYAAVPDEYLCFSEFPIGKGFVDFVVFTGRSRMDIFLIEIKGAEFNLVNSNSYAEFNAKIHEGAGQIRQRYREIYESLSNFRQSFHRIRETVEAGQSISKSFLGPKVPLEVDPNKDINVYGVVIGGRMRDDLSESKHRHDYESRFIPDIKVDSWDSWIKRLQRK